MKKLIIIIFGILVICFFWVFRTNFDQSNFNEISEYTVNNTDEVVMRVVAESVSETGLQFEIKYSGEDEGNYGTWYSIEFQIDDIWYVLPYTYKNEEEIGWDDLAFPVEKDVSRQDKIDWKWLYGSLEPGNYRIIKDFSTYGGCGDYRHTYYLAAEFVVE